MDELVGADALVEVEDVGAAAEHDVLTAVAFFAGLRVLEGAGAASQAAGGFEERDLAACRLECDGGGHAGEAGTDDDHAALTRWRRHLEREAFQPMRSLVRTESETRARMARWGSAA